MHAAASAMECRRGGRGGPGICSSCEASSAGEADAFHPLPSASKSPTLPDWRAPAARHATRRPRQHRRKESRMPKDHGGESKGTRVIALVGPAGAGKTSLAEAFLFASGTTDRQGSVANKSSIGDSSEEAR